MNFIPEFDNVFLVFYFLDCIINFFFGCPWSRMCKGDSSLSSVCLADNVDSLEDHDAGLDHVPLDSESEL